MSRMEMEEQNIDTEEWGIPQCMLQHLGEIKHILYEQLVFLEYYSLPQNQKNYAQQKQNLDSKEDSLKKRLENYKKMHQEFIQAKQIYQIITQLAKDQRLLKNRVHKIQLKDQIQMNDPTQQIWEFEDIKDPKFKEENQIIYLRNKNKPWWCIRIIKYILEKNKQFIIDIEVFLCDKTKEMKSQEQIHTNEIMKQVNFWFKQFFFSNLGRKMVSSKFKENALQYIDDTMSILFSSQKCSECDEIYKQNEFGQFTQPCVKQNEKNICHYSCLFN